MSRSSSRLALDQRVGFIVLTSDPAVVIAGLKSGLFWVQLESGAKKLLIDPEPDLPKNRINDGTVDLDGGLLFGTMDDDEREPSGSLYRLSPDLQLTRFDHGYVVSNGLFPSPVEPTVYAVDSVGRHIYRFRRHCDGSLQRNDVFTNWPESWGIPDGLICDTEGGVWVAHWGGSRLSRFLPNGEVDRVFDLPVSRVTKACFGGQDLRDLFVTTAQAEAGIKAEPVAGHLFYETTNFKGLRSRIAMIPDHFRAD